MFREKGQAIIDELTDEIFELRQENDRLKVENRRLGGTAGVNAAIQERQCVNCRKRLPDGPVYFPGYSEPRGATDAAETYRHFCIYCRDDSR